MREFFRGWRRKVGLVTLVMALVFMGGWMRSEETADYFASVEPGSFVELISISGGIVWANTTCPDSQPPAGLGPLLNGYSQFKSSSLGIFPFNLEGGRWNTTFRYEWAGFIFASGTSGTIQIVTWIIPYWSIVLPLTVISAYLLLIQRHKSNPGKITELIATEGT